MGLHGSADRKPFDELIPSLGPIRLSRAYHPAAMTHERNSFLRLFGSPRELIAKAESDLARLAAALADGRQRDALWALADCSISTFHIGDWIRCGHTDHHRATADLATQSMPIRMARDICHAAKHGDLMWKPADAANHGPVLRKLEYKTMKGGDAPQRIVAVAQDGTEHDVVEVLRLAIAAWTRFIVENGIQAHATSLRHRPLDGCRPGG